MVANTGNSTNIQKPLELAEISQAKNHSSTQVDTQSINEQAKNIAQQMQAAKAELENTESFKAAQQQQEMSKSYQGSFSSQAFGNALVMKNISQFLSPKDHVALFDAAGQNPTANVHYKEKISFLRESSAGRAIEKPQSALEEVSILKIADLAGNRKDILSTLKMDLAYLTIYPSKEEIDNLLQKIKANPAELAELKPYLELRDAKKAIFNLSKQNPEEQKTSMTLIAGALSELTKQEKTLEESKVTRKIFPAGDRNILSNKNPGGNYLNPRSHLHNLQDCINHIEETISNPDMYALNGSNTSEIKTHIKSLKNWLYEQIGEVPAHLLEKKAVAETNFKRIENNLESMRAHEQVLQHDKTSTFRETPLILERSKPTQLSIEREIIETKKGIKELEVELYSHKAKLGSLKKEINSLQNDINKKRNQPWKPESLEKEIESLEQISSWTNENSGITIPIRNIGMIDAFVKPVLTSMKNIQEKIPEYQKNDTLQENKSDFKLAKTMLLEQVFVQMDKLHGSAKTAANTLIKEHQFSTKKAIILENGEEHIQKIRNEKSGRKQVNILRNHLFSLLGKENHDAAKLGIELIHAMPEMNVNSSYNHRNAQGIAYTAIKSMLSGRFIKGSPSFVQTELNSGEKTDLLCALAEVLPRLSNAPRPQEFREKFSSTKRKPQWHCVQLGLWSLTSLFVGMATHGIGAAVIAGALIAGAIPTRAGVRDKFFKKMMDDIDFPYRHQNEPEQAFEMVKEKLPVWNILINNFEKYSTYQQEKILEKYASLVKPSNFDVSSREELVKLTVDMNSTLVSKLLDQKIHSKEAEFKLIMQLLDRQETLCPVIRESEQKAQTPIWTQLLDNLPKFTLAQQQEISRQFAANTNINQWG